MVVAFYSPDGTPIQAYDRADLFTKIEIDRFEHSMSSISWWKNGGTYFRKDQDTLSVTVEDGSGASYLMQPRARTETGAMSAASRTEIAPGGRFGNPTSVARQSLIEFNRSADSFLCGW
jgi:hypothetical protein